MSLGLYLHIPYCFSKCRYCDFYSAPGVRGVPAGYTDALLRELTRFAPDAPLHPDTLYFGGGTPSLLRPADAARLIEAAQPLPGAEITLEANPETVTEQTLREFRAAGVNRISFGVQSARDTQLRTLGRPHTAKQARAAFTAARRAGFENISGDIMLALPHYTQAEFDETLELIQQGGATHISAYLLKNSSRTLPLGASRRRDCPPRMKRPTSTYTLWSSWSTTATASTRSPTLRSPVMRAVTI